MIHVFQGFKRQARIPKTDYTPEVRKAFLNGDKPVLPVRAYIEKDQLFMVGQQDEKLLSKQNAAVLIQDELRFSSMQMRPKSTSDQGQSALLSEVFCFYQQKKIWIFELFSLVKNKDGSFDLNLRYEENAFRIGGPLRKDHKLCVLRRGEPVEIRINGRSDFTMSGTQQRTYQEYIYLIEYLGDVQSIEFRPEHHIRTRQRVLPIPKKIIDLRIPFY